MGFFIKLIDVMLPKKYKKNKAPDNNNCVTGSAEGVNIAPKMVQTSIIGLQQLSISFGSIILDTLSII